MQEASYAPLLHSYLYAVALEVAILLFVVNGYNLISYAFATVSIAANLAYYYIHGVSLFTYAALPVWLISIALPCAIALYSHLLADAGNGAESAGGERGNAARKAAAAGIRAGKPAISPEDEAAIAAAVPLEIWTTSPASLPAGEAAIAATEPAADRAVLPAILSEDGAANQAAIPTISPANLPAVFRATSAAELAADRAVSRQPPQFPRQNRRQNDRQNARENVRQNSHRNSAEPRSPPGNCR